MSTLAGRRQPPDPTALVGTLLSYDVEAYPIPDLFQDCVSDFLKKNGLRPSRPLGELHHAVDFERLSELTPFLFSMLNGSEFQTLYRRFIEDVIAPLFPKPIGYQWVPNPRVHLPKGRTVQYHTDEWYGHGPNAFNFWLPMTRAYGSNTLRAASLADSIRLCRQFERDKLPQHEINKRSALSVTPVECGPGQIYVFNARCLHGTEQNRTPQTRVSMDFRILQRGDSSGDKPLGAYYRTLADAVTRKTSSVTVSKPLHAAAYVYPRYGFTRFVSQPHQRLIIDAFARKNSAIVVDEETEIRTMPHHPALLQLATGAGLKKINAVILFSVLCLPPKAQDRTKILRTAKASGVRVLFASESLHYPDRHSEADIEETYRSLARA